MTVGAATAAVGLAGCGSDWPSVQQDGEPSGASPRIVAAEALDSGVQVTYRVPGADGGEWPVLKISVQSPESSLPATSRNVSSVDEEGTVVVPIEIEPGRQLIAFGSAFYENGQRVHLAEQDVRSSAGGDGTASERESDQANGYGFDGYWEAIGRLTWVPPTVVSNQPVGTVRKRPWSFQEFCRRRCKVVFTRGTLYGPSVTRLVKSGRTFVAEFPPVRVPCSYPQGSNLPRRSVGRSHSRYKLWWSSDRSQLHAIEHRFQTGCYRTPNKPDVTRWRARRSSSPTRPEDMPPAS